MKLYHGPPLTVKHLNILIGGKTAKSGKVFLYIVPVILYRTLFD